MLYIALPTLRNLFGREEIVKIGTFNGNRCVLLLLFGSGCTKVFPSIEVCIVYRAEGTSTPRVDDAVRSKNYFHNNALRRI